MMLTGYSGVNGIVQFLTIVILFVIVVAITLFATRWMSNYQKGKSLGTNIEIIETYRISVNKYVQIIRVGDKYLAIAVGKDEVTFLSEVAQDEIHLPERTSMPMPDFASILEKIRNKNNKKQE